MLNDICHCKCFAGTCYSYKCLIFQPRINPINQLFNCLRLIDHVIIINAEKVRLTGTNKASELIYHHSGYPGGIKSISRGKQLAKTPALVVLKTVRGMLPHNKLGDALIKKLRVHPGSEHNHDAQKPEVLTF